MVLLAIVSASAVEGEQVMGTCESRGGIKTPSCYVNSMRFLGQISELDMPFVRNVKGIDKIYLFYWKDII